MKQPEKEFSATCDLRKYDRTRFEREFFKIASNHKVEFKKLKVGDDRYEYPWVDSEQFGMMYQLRASEDIFIDLWTRSNKAKVKILSEKGLNFWRAVIDEGIFEGGPYHRKEKPGNTTSAGKANFSDVERLLIDKLLESGLSPEKFVTERPIKYLLFNLDDLEKEKARIFLKAELKKTLRRVEEADFDLQIENIISAQSLRRLKDRCPR